MSLFEHDDNAIGQTEAISNIYATVIPSNSIPARPTNVLFVRFILIHRQKFWLRTDMKNDHQILINVSFRVTITVKEELNRMWNILFNKIWENSQTKPNLMGLDGSLFPVLHQNMPKLVT